MPKTRILLVEGDAKHQSLLGMALTNGRPDVELCTVANGEECLKKTGECLFDCLVLDFKLPDYEADELLPILTKNPNNCPVVVVSSNRDQEVVIRTMRNGGVDFVPKTVAIDSDNLWRRIAGAIEQHRRHNRQRQQVNRRMKQLAQLAETDPLTEIPNRRYGDRLLGGLSHRAYDRRGPVSILMLDIDHFKAINDTYGHAVGDDVLRAIAETLRTHAKKQDTLCRWGGEEFIVVKPSTSLAEAVAWAEDVRQAIEHLKGCFNDRIIPVTASLGVIECPGQQVGLKMIARADRAMYLAKARGRNRVCTGGMVAFQEILELSGGSEDDTLEQRRNDVLDLCWDRLGITQREHLGGHSDRVGGVAVCLGRVLGIDRQTREGLRTAALLHDLGKLVIPEEVLGKPSALSPQELELVSRHAEDGADMSIDLGASRLTADWIRHHHARFDGKGPPSGLRGEAIPLEARILGVADALDAMTSQRPYRSAYSTASAMDELQQERGHQFDPSLVDIVPDALRAQAQVRTGCSENLKAGLDGDSRESAATIGVAGLSTLGSGHCE